MNLGLDGKRALVLGSSDGLGKAVATELAREGARVAVCSRDESRASTAAEAIVEETGGEAVAFVVDVAEDGSLAALVAAVAERFGGLDLLVCNAGGPPPGDFRALNEGAWDRAYQLTLQSVVRSIRYALPHLEVGNDPAVLAIGSSSVAAPIPNLLLSNVFRPAVHALINALAEEFADAGVRLNLLSPGRIHTSRVDALDQANAERSGRSFSEIRAASLASIPMGRLGEPGEFGRVAAFLLSPAASYMTGSSVLVDGGKVRSL